MQVWSLGEEDPLKEEMTDHSSILSWTIPLTKSLAGYSTWGPKESDTEQTKSQTKNMHKIHFK